MPPAWRGCLGGWRDWLQGRSSFARPDQHSTILVNGQLVHLDDFDLQIFEILVIQAKLVLQGTIRYPSLALEHGECLSQDLLKCHDQPSAYLASAPRYNRATLSLSCLTMYHIQ